MNWGVKYDMQKKLDFPIIHKVGNFGIFVLLKFENSWDIVMSHMNFDSKRRDKRKI